MLFHCIVLIHKSLLAPVLQTKQNQLMLMNKKNKDTEQYNPFDGGKISVIKADLTSMDKK